MSKFKNIKASGNKNVIGNGNSVGNTTINNNNYYNNTSSRKSNNGEAGIAALFGLGLLGITL